MGLMLVTILEVGDAINGSYVSDPLRARKVFLSKSWRHLSVYTDVKGLPRHSQLISDQMLICWL